MKNDGVVEKSRDHTPEKHHLSSHRSYKHTKVNSTITPQKPNLVILNNPSKKIFPEDFFSQPKQRAKNLSTVSEKNIINPLSYDKVENGSELIIRDVHSAGSVKNKIRKVPSFREVLKIDAIPEEDEEKMKTASANFLRQSENKNYSQNKIIFDKFSNYALGFDSKIISSNSNFNEEDEGMDYFDELDNINFTPTPIRDKSSESNIINNEASTSGSYIAPVKTNKKIFNFDNFEVLNNLNIPIDDNFKQTACFSPMPSSRRETNKENCHFSNYEYTVKEVNVSQTNINDISEIGPAPSKIKVNANSTCIVQNKIGNNFKNLPSKVKKENNISNTNNTKRTTRDFCLKLNTLDPSTPPSNNFLGRQNSASKFKINKPSSNLISHNHSDSNGDKRPASNALNSNNTPCNNTATTMRLVKTPSTGRLKITNNEKKFSNSPNVSEDISSNKVKYNQNNNDRLTERGENKNSISPKKNQNSINNTNYNNLPNPDSFNTITSSHSSCNMLTSRFNTPQSNANHRKSNFCNSNKNMNNFNKKFSNANFYGDSSSHSNVSAASTNMSPMISHNPSGTMLPSILPPLTSRGEPKKIQFELSNIFHAAQNFQEDPEVKHKIDSLLKNIVDIKNVIQEKSKRAGLTSAPTDRKILNEISQGQKKMAMQKPQRSDTKHLRNNSSGDKSKRNSLK